MEPTTKILILALFSFAGCVGTCFFVVETVRIFKSLKRKKKAIVEKCRKEREKLEVRRYWTKVYVEVLKEIARDPEKVDEEVESAVDGLLNELNLKVEEEWPRKKKRKCCSTRCGFWPSTC